MCTLSFIDILYMGDCKCYKFEVTWALNLVPPWLASSYFHSVIIIKVTYVSIIVVS